MQGKYGIEGLKTAAADSAKIFSIGYKALKGNYLSLVGLVSVFLDVRKFDFAELRQELSDVNPQDRADIEAAFTSNLDLGNADLQAKVVAVVGTVDDVFALVQEGVHLFNGVAAFIAKLKVIFGL